MNVKTAIASVPLLRKAWRILPGPLKLPVLLLGLVYVIWRWRRDDEEDGHGAQGGLASPGSADGRNVTTAESAAS